MPTKQQKATLIQSRIAEQAAREVEAIEADANSSANTRRAAIAAHIGSRLDAASTQVNLAARGQIDRALFAERSRLRAEYFAERQRLTKEVFDAADGHIRAHANSPEYADTLEAMREIFLAMDAAETGYLVRARTGDMALLQGLDWPGVTLQIDDENTLGGLVFLREDTGLLVDLRFATLLEAQKPWFFATAKWAADEEAAQ